jgi:hypothetical protein
MKRGTRWLKRVAQEWFDRTRDLDIRDRGVLNELELLMDFYDGSVPDRARTISARMQISVQMWIASKNRLIRDGFVKETPEGLVIETVMELIQERSQRFANHRKGIAGGAAPQRRANGRRAVEQLHASPNAASIEQPPQKVSDTSTTASQNVTQTQNHRQTQNSNREIGGEAEKDFSGIRLNDDDQPAKPEATVRPLALSLVRATELEARSEERAAEIIKEYLNSDYGRNRRTDRAYINWVWKTYGLRIDPRGSTMNFRQLSEIAGLDRSGRQETSLPSSKVLASRREKLSDKLEPRLGQNPNPDAESSP